MLQSRYRTCPVLCIVSFFMAYAINLAIIKMKARRSTETGGERCAETEEMQESMSDANDKRVPSDWGILPANLLLF